MYNPHLRAHIPPLEKPSSLRSLRRVQLVVARLKPDQTRDAVLQRGVS